MGTPAINNQTPWYLYENESPVLASETADEQAAPALWAFAPMVPRAISLPAGEGLAVNAARFAKLPKVPAGPAGIALAVASVGAAWYLSGSEEESVGPIGELGFSPYESQEIDLENPPQTEIRYAPLADPATTIGEPPTSPVVIPAKPSEEPAFESDDISMSAEEPAGVEAGSGSGEAEPIDSLDEIKWTENIDKTGSKDKYFPYRGEVRVGNEVLKVLTQFPPEIKYADHTPKYHLIRAQNPDGTSEFYLYIIIGNETPNGQHAAAPAHLRMFEKGRQTTMLGIAAGFFDADGNHLFINGASAYFPTTKDQYSGRSELKITDDEKSGLDAAVELLKKFFKNVSHSG